MIKLVATCTDCLEGSVPYNPPNITSCRNCGAEYICNNNGSMIPVNDDIEYNAGKHPNITPPKIYWPATFMIIGVILMILILIISFILLVLG